MVVNKKNSNSILFELGIQLFLGTGSGFLTALCRFSTGVEFVTPSYRRKVMA